MTIVEKAAYLKGLVEGLGVDSESRDGKLWGALTGLLSDMAHEIEDLQASNMDFADALDEIGEELSYLEELTCDLDMPEDYEDCDGNCVGCSGCDDFEDDEDEDDEDEDEDDEDEDEDDEDDDEDDDDDEDEDDDEFEGLIYEVVCPVCGDEIVFDEDILDKGSIKCPSCGELLEFDGVEYGEEDK